MNKLRILVNTPDLSLNGGVSSHYNGLRPYWSCDVHHNVVGARKNIPGPIILIYDFIKFIFLCAFGDYDIILLNPSLGKTALKRDALFLKISKRFKIKTVVFFHGWSVNMIATLNENSDRFNIKFNIADKIIVLAQSFKRDLIKWGITKPIYLSTTKVNDVLLNDFDINNKPWESNILFLTRVETYKGIFTTLKAYKIVQSNYPSATLTIAGDGSQLQKAKEFVIQNKIEGVSFLGNINGAQLTKSFSEASIYILPSHSEGMPTSVLEAMAFGLPIISRPVGGLVDFFEENKMGYLIESHKPEEYADKIRHLLENPEMGIEIGKYNYEYAFKHFMASKVALNLEEILIN